MAFSSISVSSFLSPVKTFVFGYGNHPDDQDDLNSSSVETPGNSVIKKPPSNAGDVSSIPGLGTKIPHVSEQRSPLAATRRPSIVMHAYTHTHIHTHTHTHTYTHKQKCLPICSAKTLFQIRSHSQVLEFRMWTYVREKSPLNTLKLVN